MKSKTLIYLEARDLHALRAQARTQRISLAELVRRLVTRHLQGPPDIPPPEPSIYLKLVALGSSGRSDISERHDQYVADAVRREHAR